jgi:hypothetical protein
MLVTYERFDGVLSYYLRIWTERDLLDPDLWFLFLAAWEEIGGLLKFKDERSMWVAVLFRFNLEAFDRGCGLTRSIDLRLGLQKVVVEVSRIEGISCFLGIFL